MTTMWTIILVWLALQLPLDAGEIKRHLNVFDRRQVGHEIERLKYEADFFAAELRALGDRKLKQRPAREKNFAAGRRKKAPQQ